MSTLRELKDRGFVIVSDVVSERDLRPLSAAYDIAVTEASEPDRRVGSTTTRVHGILDRAEELRELSACPALLDVCREVLPSPFRLSSFLARTVHPYATAQPLHVDLRVPGESWPLVGFILMIDDFTVDNGATRFIPESHRWSCDPDDREVDEVLACGRAGSMIIYSGAAWHGHSANRTARPRRSLQGAYIASEF